MKRIILFLALTFSLSWAVEFWLMANGGMSHPYWRVFLSGVMLLPALCSLLTRLITKEGFSNMMLGLRLKSCKKTWLIAWFGPAVLILIGAGIYFLIFPSHFDSGFSVMRSMLQGVQNADGTTAEITTEVIVSAFLSQIVVAVIFGPLLNILFTFGEELGWRGYLLPKIAEVKGRRFAVIASGVIWGIWHAPVIAQGYNYGSNYPGFPYFGIIAMIFFCVFCGSFFSWLTFSSGTVFPAAAAHGGLNAFSGISIYVFAGTMNPFIGPIPLGIIGGIGFIIAGIYCYLKIDQVKTVE